MDEVTEIIQSKAEEEQKKEDRKDRLNTYIAITIALLATFIGICKVKDDNIVQAMQQAQADKVDQYNFYQARNIREEIDKSTITQLKLQAINQPVKLQSEYQKAIATYEKLANDQSKKKQEQLEAAKKAQADYDQLNFHDDQFDLSDASLAIAISILAVTSLTQKRWLYGVAMVPTVLGLIMGLSGLFSWNLHPDFLIKPLTYRTIDTPNTSIIGLDKTRDLVANS
ncbi:hypothetical protein Syn7502_01196 [Synechococcus sp. PCC 7502]|uniref:DUF4337 domain-containing protein n=1 Tax=Synechococcus sp. PCC 7502 TaxID=1173263 RepID=UPI00029FE446|nr:DUF4337 domain-containing protein [Synechococcus sp. PCC 7502]AFY73299.1 hypothetical protein Syn7502_01196 [Synechococcus sp. PCC 7502]